MYNENYETLGADRESKLTHTQKKKDSRVSRCL